MESKSIMIPQIALLEGKSNWENWKVKIRMGLKMIPRAIEIIDGTYKCPSEPDKTDNNAGKAYEADLATFNKIDNQALLVMSNNMTEEMFEKVSWIRHRDLNLLTVASYTYTSDERFVTKHSPQTEEWTLQIRFAQLRDSGVYQCQIGTNPPIGLTMTLTVVEPVTRIVGGPDLHINYGSTINLTCVVIHSPVPPPSIIWTHNDKEVNYDSPRGGVSVITEKGDNTTSYLLIQRARYNDSGSYKCIPSNADPLSVFVHIMNEKPEAMQRGSQLQVRSEAAQFFVLSMFVLLLQ